MFEVYILGNKINGNLYVGKTTKGFHERWRLHVYAALIKKEQYPLSRAIRKYGPESFELVWAIEVNSEEKQNESEIKLIATLCPEYNATSGGDGSTGWHHTEEARIKMRKAAKGRKAPNVPWTPERKEKSSQSHKGKKWKHPNPRKGIPNPKVSAALKGKKK
jgi:group I intron endonuclease